MDRIPLVASDALTPEQARVYAKIVAGPRGAVVGPLRAALHSPELAERWSALGEVLRYGTSLPKRLGELAIIVTARRWNAQIEWHVHAQAARAAGLADAVVHAIEHGRAPRFADLDEAAVYEFVRELQQAGQVSDAVYAKAHDRLGTVGVVELTALVGYYTMVAMTLNAHHIPLPDGAAPLAALGPGLAVSPAADTAGGPA